MQAGIFDEVPNYLHLIDYKAGSGIPPHVDREELGEVVAGLTLGSSRVFEFRREEDGPPEVRVLLCPGDLYVLSGAARHRWYHGVPFTRADELKQRGLTLGHPYSSAIKGSDYPLRELRLRVHGHAVRVFYIFDVKRQAVVLVGGDKTGDDRFYETMVPMAESIWEQYLKEQAKAAKEKKS